MFKSFYPLTFYPICKDYIWGGTKLFEYGKTSDKDIIAESWEVSENPNGESIVDNGKFKDKSLNSLIKEYGKDILGTSFVHKEFPLLIKLIDARDNLSIQVHPDDMYAQNIENVPFGKNEMWYILECEPNSFVYSGIKKGSTREILEQAIKDNTILKHLKKQPVKAGDVIYITSGTVHAITKGLTLIEIQQNSDITYRLYDYNRIGKDGKPRELHLQKALDVIDYFSNSNKLIKYPEFIYTNKNKTQKLIECPYFTAKRWCIVSNQPMVSNKKKFSTFTVIKGEGELVHNRVVYPLCKGKTVLIPAVLGRYTLRGNMELIEAIP